MLSFDDFMILENQTVAQFLKTHPNAKDIKQVVSQYLAPVIHNQAQNTFIRYVNWFAKELIVQNIDENQLDAMLDTMWTEIGDYIVAHLNNNQLQSRFNLKDFTYAQATQLSHEWHLTLDDPSKSRVGPEGRTIIPLQDGWKWVALDRGYCSKEGQAAGHCGNVGSKGGDNIYSLRDKDNVVHLTFINNGGILGEMKGRGNSKPAQKYHDAIIKLLLSNYVGAVEGGGYASENNFSLHDLTDQQFKYIKSQKPYIDNPDGFAKYRLKLQDSFARSKHMKDLRSAQTDEELKTAISNLAWNKNPSGELPYEIKKPDDIPERVQRNKVWESCNKILDETYQRAKTIPPDKLFVWMDKAIKIYIELVVATDLKTFNDLPDKHYFISLNNVMKIDEFITNLVKQQPMDVMKRAPKRVSFGSWKEYYDDLADYLDSIGYELPPWSPKNNHMISYEYLMRLAEELTKQGKPVMDAVNDVYKNATKEQKRLLDVNIMTRNQRLHDPDYKYPKEHRRRNREEGLHDYEEQ